MNTKINIQNTNINCKTNCQKAKNNNPAFGSYFELSEDLLDLASRKTITSNVQTFPCLQKISGLLKTIVKMQNTKPTNHLENNEVFVLDIEKYQNIYRLVARSNDSGTISAEHSKKFDLREMIEGRKLGLLPHKLQELVSGLQDNINKLTINPKKKYSQEQIDSLVEGILNPANNKHTIPDEIEETLERIEQDTHNDETHPKKLFDQRYIDEVFQRTVQS